MGILDYAKSIIVGRDDNRGNFADVNAERDFRQAMAGFGIRLQSITEDIEKNSVVEACLQRLIKGVNGGVLEVQRPIEGGWETIPNHRALELVGSDVIEHFIRSAYYCGNGVATITRYENTDVADLVPLPYKSLRISRRGNLFVGYTVYNYKDSGVLTKAPLVETEVVDFTLSKNIDKPWLGRSPLVTAVDELKTDKAVKIFTVSFLRNFAHPGMIVMPKSKDGRATYDEATITTIAKQLKDKFTGENVGNSLISPTEIEVFELKGIRSNIPIQEMLFVPESRIAGVMDVPPALAGLLVGMENTQTNATQVELNLQFAEGTLQPLQRKIASTLTRQFLYHFPGPEGMRFFFNNKENHYFAVDIDRKAERVRGLWNDGLLTRNQSLNELDYEPDTQNGDVYKYQLVNEVAQD